MRKIVSKIIGSFLLLTLIGMSFGGSFAPQANAQGTRPDATCSERRDHYYADRDCYVQCLYFSLDDCDYYAAWHWDCSAGGPPSIGG